MASDEEVVVSAPSVEEAIIIGLTRLTATRDEVEIEVLEEASRGFLGIGMKEARVRLTRRPNRVAPAAPVAVEEADASQDSAATSAAPVEAKVREAEALELGEVEPEPEAAEVEEATESPTEEKAVEPEAVAEVTIPTEKQERSEPVSTKEAPSRSDGLDRDRVEALAREIAANLLGDLNIDVVTEWIDEDRPTIWISLEGRDADSLVGPRARNLHAVQYLFRALIYHKYDGEYNVVVDADGYRKRRRRSLESLAEQKADRAVELGKTIRLRPMPAHERRIIHITLRKDDRVSTQSVGTGRDRAVTIIPRSRSSSGDGS